MSVVNSVAFSGDGTRVVSGGQDGRLVVWDASSGDKVQEIEGAHGLSEKDYGDVSVALRNWQVFIISMGKNEGSAAKCVGHFGIGTCIV